MGIGEHYQCQTHPLNVESSQYVTSVTGIHLANKTNNDVAAIHISKCNDLTYIPKGLVNVFPNLIGVYLQGCGISSLNGTELIEYPLLQLFALELSPLQHVPGNLFEHNPDIFFVSFTDNTIRSTGRELLTNLDKLSEIYFENNTCISANVTTMQGVPGFIEKLNNQCSFASEISQSVALIAVLSVMVCFGNYIWMK